MRYAVAVITTTLTVFSFSTHAVITRFQQPTVEIAAHLLETFLNAPGAQSSLELDKLTEELNDLPGLPPERLLALIWNEALPRLKNELTLSQNARIESVLRIHVVPPRHYDFNNSTKELKAQAFELLTKFVGSSLTQQAVASRIRQFHLWIPEQYDWIKELAGTRAGLTFAYPAIEALQSRWSENQKDQLADVIRRGVPSMRTLPAIYQLERLNDQDVRVLLKIGSEIYAAQGPQNPLSATAQITVEQSEERQALIDAIFGMRKLIRMNADGRLTLFEEEKARTFTSYSAFDKHANFYKMYLKPEFEFPEHGQETKREAKVIFATFRGACDKDLD